MRRLLVVTRCAVALVVLVALVAGAPFVLTLFGNPVSEIADVFGDELSSDSARIEALLTGLLVSIGWIAWLMVVAAICVEVIAVVGGRVSPRLPMLPGVQPFARALVTAVTLSGTILSAAQTAPMDLPPLQAAALSDPVVPSTSGERVTDSSPQAPESAVPGPTYLVVRSDTWWSMADRLLGAGNRWQEIVQVNVGRTMVDGSVIEAETTRPRPGWSVSLPADAVLPLATAPFLPGDSDAPDGLTEYEIVAGDTLWDIAVRHLPPGTPTEDVVTAVADITDINRSRRQPDGRTLTDPNVLEPGWVLMVPTSTTDPRDAALPKTVTVEEGDTLWELAAEHLGSGDLYTEIVEANIDRPQAGGGALTNADLIEPGWELDIPASAPEVQSTEPPAEATPPPEQPNPTEGDPTPDFSSPQSPTEPPTRLPSTLPSSPPPVQESIPSAPTSPAGDAETDDAESGPSVPIGLVTAGLATAGAVVLLDRRRRVQRQRRRSGHTLPSPSPIEEQQEIALRSGADLPMGERVAVALQAAAAGAPAGLPSIRFITASKQTIRVHLVGEHPSAPEGFRSDGTVWESTASHDELEPIAQGRIDPLPLLCPIGTTSDGAEQVLVDLESAGVLYIDGPQERLDGLLRSMALATSTTLCAESPQVVAVGMSGEIAELEWVQTKPTLIEGLEVVRRHIEGGASHSAASPMVVDTWDPIVLVSHTPCWEIHRGHLSDLARSAPNGSAVVVPGSPVDQDGVAAIVDDRGIIDYPGVDVEVTASGLSSEDVRVVSVLLDTASMLDADVPTPAGTPPIGVRSVPELDDELDRFDVLVRIMGDVTVERLDSSATEPVGFERTRAQEAVVYLAAREEGRGVAIEDVSAALWPDGRAVDQTVRNTISRARSGLGSDASGDPYLPAPVDRRYHLSERVVTDFEIFWSLRQAAEEVDDADVSAQLLDQALDLVRGEPFLGPGRGYAWTSTLGTTVIVAVVDVADDLGRIRLHDNDNQGAERAARAGLKIAPGEERLYRILMRAAAARDSKQLVERLYRELLDVLADPDLGIEPESTVSDETVDLFNELRGRRRQTA